MANAGYFDMTRNIAIINAGGFFCQACLVDKPLDDRSPDPRYCQDCYDFLLKEAEMLSPGKRPAWIPKTQQPKIGGKKQYHIPEDVVSIMSPLQSKKIEGDIIPPPAGKVTHEKRGPKHRPLPEDLIMRLAGEGLGTKAIAVRLRGEYGIKVSYKTIQRMLSGERKQLALPIDVS